MPGKQSDIGGWHFRSEVRYGDRNLGVINTQVVFKAMGEDQITQGGSVVREEAQGQPSATQVYRLDG